MTEQLETEKLPSIQIDFTTMLADVKNITEVRQALESALPALKAEKGIERIGFVSGRLGKSVDDPELRKRLMKEDETTMKDYIQELRAEYQFPIFGSPDIFISEVWDRLEEAQPSFSQAIKRQKMNELFTAVLTTCGVTDLFSMDTWQDAKGAIVERGVAQKNKLTIHDQKPKED